MRVNSDSSSAAAVTHLRSQPHVILHDPTAVHNIVSPLRTHCVILPQPRMKGHSDGMEDGSPINDPVLQHPHLRTHPVFPREEMFKGGGEGGMGISPRDSLAIVSIAEASGPTPTRPHIHRTRCSPHPSSQPSTSALFPARLNDPCDHILTLCFLTSRTPISRHSLGIPAADVLANAPKLLKSTHCMIVTSPHLTHLRIHPRSRTSLH